MQPRRTRFDYVKLMQSQRQKQTRTQKVKKSLKRQQIVLKNEMQMHLPSKKA